MGLLSNLLVVLPNYAFLISFLAAFLGGEETIVFLGVLVSRHYFSLWIVFLFSLMGVMIADIFWFFLGKAEFLSYFKKCKTIHKGYKKAGKLIDSTSKMSLAWTLIFIKLTYGVGIFTLMYLGRTKTNFKKFFTYNLSIIVVWISFLIFMGWLAGRGFTLVLTIFDNLMAAITLLFVFGIAFYILMVLFSKWLTKKQKL